MPTDYEIKSIEKLPKSLKATGKIYDDMLKDLRKKPVGNYLIEPKNRKPLSVYVALNKKIKENNIKDLRLHFLNKEVYVERL